MNNFAKIIRIEGFTGNSVNFYTVHIEGRERNEFEDFIFRHLSNTKIQVQLNYLNETLERFSKNGAKQHYFRHEGAFHALPPPAKYLEINLGEEQIRLYCLYVSSNIVFLFNGGVKTQQKAQDCKNVKGHFSEANNLTAKIDTLIKEDEIKFNPERTEINNHQTIELWLT